MNTEQDLMINSRGIKYLDTGEEINIDPNSLKYIDTIGRGACSHVYLAKNLETNKLVAVKAINSNDKEKRKQLVTDLNILRANVCPFLVEFYGAFYDDGQVKILLEYMDGGNLTQVITKLKRFVEKEKAELESSLIPEPIIARIIHQLLHALIYVHKVMNQIHRDIKPDNILLDTKGAIKLADFGISKNVENNNDIMAMTYVGTIAYMSPERLQNLEQSFASDIWALGVIVWEMATGTQPFGSNKEQMEILDNVLQKNLPKLDQNIQSVELSDFVDKCLNIDPQQRMTCIQLASHPFIIKHMNWKVDLPGWIKFVSEL